MKFIATLIDFNLDRHLNPIIPPNRCDVLPQPFRHFLGHRKQSPEEPPALAQHLSALVVTIAGLALVGGIYNTAPGITRLHPPSLIASLGASAVLEYSTIHSPLAQPRNAILGHTLSAIIGVGISKLFQLDPLFFSSQHYQWVAAAIACGCASVVMSLTNSTHPPGGATAILACTEASILAMGWWFVALILLASALMLTVGLIGNNILRQYPSFWWTPEEVGQKLPFGHKREVEEEGDDEEKLKRHTSAVDSERTLRHEISRNVEFVDGAEDLRITPRGIQAPAHMKISPDVLEILERLQEHLSTDLA